MAEDNLEMSNEKLVKEFGAELMVNLKDIPDFYAFKTGIFMTITALAAVLPAFFIITGLPDSFRQIFFILALGLGADIINTWLTNASIIKWYCEKKGIR